MTAPVIKQLDFLPEKYRHATRRRRTSYWRVVVVLMFVGVFAAAAWGMRSAQVAVRREYEQTAARYAAAQAQAAVLQAHEARLAELRGYADLLTFLRTPWPRSQIVAQLFAPLPPGVIVDKFRIVSEPRAVVAAAPVEVPAEAVAAETVPSAAADLETLRKAAEAVDVVIHLEGTAHDQPGLHAYLHQLAAGKLFRSADVESIEAARAADGNPAVSAGGASRFTARIVVRPGWGLADGPTPEAAPSAESASPPAESAPTAEATAPVAPLAAAGGDA